MPVEGKGGAGRTEYNFCDLKKVNPLLFCTVILTDG